MLSAELFRGEPDRGIRLPQASVHLTRKFAAPANLLFACLTDERHLTEWLVLPAGSRVLDCSVDARPGGWFSLSIKSEKGIHANIAGAIVAFQPPHAIAGIARVAVGASVGWFRFDLRLRAVPGGTELVHFAYPEDGRRFGDIAHQHHVWPRTGSDTRRLQPPLQPCPGRS